MVYALFGWLTSNIPTFTAISFVSRVTMAVITRKKNAMFANTTRSKFVEFIAIHSNVTCMKRVFKSLIQDRFRTTEYFLSILRLRPTNTNAIIPRHPR